MSKDFTIDDYQITRFDFPRDRVIGDSQVRIERISLATLELITNKDTWAWDSSSIISFPYPYWPS